MGRSAVMKLEFKEEQEVFLKKNMNVKEMSQCENNWVIGSTNSQWRKKKVQISLNKPTGDTIGLRT